MAGPGPGLRRPRRQNIALGERVPELKVQTWLGRTAATQPALTYVEFFHSSNPAAHRVARTAPKAITDKLGAKLRVVVVTRENEEKIAPLLSPFLSTASPSRWTPGQDILGVQRAVRPVPECWSTAGTGRCGWATHCS